jgi:hypothetical protein
MSKIRAADSPSWQAAVATALSVHCLRVQLMPGLAIEYEARKRRSAMLRLSVA